MRSVGIVAYIMWVWSYVLCGHGCVCHVGVVVCHAGMVAYAIRVWLHAPCGCGCMHCVHVLCGGSHVCHTGVVVCAMHVTIPASPPTFSSTSHPVASPEVPRDTSHSHVPFGLHMIHPHAPLHTIPCNPVSCPCWVRLQESPSRPSTPNAPDKPESSADPQIDSAVMTKDLSILQGLLSGLPLSLWSAVLDIDMR